MHFVLPQTVYERLSQDAKRCGLSRRAYIIKLIENTPVRERPTESIDKFRTEIHHIGNNINQATRKINAGLGTKQDVDTLLYLMGECYRLMYELTKE